MFDTYCKRDSSGPAVGETISIVVQRTEGPHLHPFVVGWFVSVIENSIAIVPRVHLRQRIDFERKMFAAESSFTIRPSWFIL
jgi:hypothetical protein